MRNELETLLAQAIELRDRFAKHSPMSSRYAILVKDCARMERGLERLA